MIPILVKSDDVRSGRKAKTRHGRHRSQWFKFRQKYPAAASIVFSSLFSVFGYPDETLSPMFDVLNEEREMLRFI